MSGGRSLPSRHLNNWTDMGVDDSDATYMADWVPVIYRTLRTKICRTICPHSIQSAFSEDRAETTKCFVLLGESRTEDGGIYWQRRF